MARSKPTPDTKIVLANLPGQDFVVRRALTKMRNNWPPIRTLYDLRKLVRDRGREWYRWIRKVVKVEHSAGLTHRATKRCFNLSEQEAVEKFIKKKIGRSVVVKKRVRRKVPA